MKVLVIGNGGREHALAWKLKESNNIDKIFMAKGNGGTEDFSENLDIDPKDIDRLLKFALEEKIDLTVVGPEDPLCADRCFSRNRLSRYAARRWRNHCLARRCPARIRSFHWRWNPWWSFPTH